MGMRNTEEVSGGGGEIVQVHGGHILRSVNRKDRHSKVYTSKGLRDRRIQLAAHTAIQFYDVQDRLGYDRPSKVVDWLIGNAKSAIDKLPQWLPNAEQQQSGFSGCAHLESDSNFPINSIDFQGYPHDSTLTSANEPQNLSLSLPSYQPRTEHALFAASENVGFEPSSDEFGRFSSLLNSPVGLDFSQRGILQSSFNMPEIYRSSTSEDHRFTSEGFFGDSSR